MDYLPPMGLMVLAGASAVEALRCLADRLLGSALVYSVAAAGLLAGAARLAVDVF